MDKVLGPGGVEPETRPKLTLPGSQGRVKGWPCRTSVPKSWSTAVEVPNLHLSPYPNVPPLPPLIFFP